MQRNYLKKLQDELHQLQKNGDHNKTIKYINNIPKIVPATSSKN